MHPTTAESLCTEVNVTQQTSYDKWVGECDCKGNSLDLTIKTLRGTKTLSKNNN